SPALKARPTDRPARVSGAALVRVLTIALNEPIEPLTRAAYAARASCGFSCPETSHSETRMTIDPTRMDSRTEMSGRASTAHAPRMRALTRPCPRGHEGLALGRRWP